MYEVSDGQGATRTLEDFIHQLFRKGITLWMEGGELRYRAPRGVLGAEERQALSRANREIAVILQRHSQALRPANVVGPSSDARRAPLSFTQLAHWYNRNRYGGRSVRHIASAHRIRGPLRIELLETSVNAAVRRHDSLRTRIVLCEGMFPVQEVSDKYGANLEVVFLGSTPEAGREAEVQRQIQRAIMEAGPYDANPLFKPVLLVLDPLEHVLILAMDHVISDLASLNILAFEIFTGYTQLLKGCLINFPQVPVQFPDHATRLLAEPPEKLMRIGRRLGSIGRARFPVESTEGAPGTRTGLGIVRFEIDRDLVGELRAWARRRGTTIVIATLTAYAALVLRWCGVKETAIAFTTDGRISADLERTIGYLAFAVYVRAGVDEDGNFLDLLKSIIEAYCTARDEADFGYATAQANRPEFTRNTAVNWLPTGCSAAGTITLGPESALSWSAMDFSNPVFGLVTQSDEEPGVSFSEREGCIVGRVSYARSRFSDAGMTRFAMNIVEFLKVMLKTPTRRVMDLELK